MPPAEFDIGEDIAHQRKVWRLERIAWTLMSLAIIAALLGFVGHGRFSDREVTAADSGLVVRYKRFERYHAQTQLILQLLDVTNAETEIHIGLDFLRGIEVMRVEPEPERVELDNGFMTYVFNTRAPGPILFNYKPVQPGPLRIDIGVDDAPLQSLPLFVYP